MTDVEKLQLIRKIANTGFELCSNAGQQLFLYGILCAINDVADSEEPEQKETPAAEATGSVKL